MVKINDPHQLQKLENLKKVLHSDKLNLKAVVRLSGEVITSHTLQDWKRGKGLLSEQQAVALITAINTLRIKIKVVLTEFDKNEKSEIAINQFKQIFKRDELVWLPIFDRDMIFYRKIQAWDMGRRIFPSDELQRLKSYLLIFLTETVI